MCQHKYINYKGFKVCVHCGNCEDQDIPRLKYPKDKNNRYYRKQVDPRINWVEIRRLHNNINTQLHMNVPFLEIPCQILLKKVPSKQIATEKQLNIIAATIWYYGYYLTYNKDKMRFYHKKDIAEICKVKIDTLYKYYKLIFS